MQKEIGTTSESEEDRVKYRYLLIIYPYLVSLWTAKQWLQGDTKNSKHEYLQMNQHLTAAKEIITWVYKIFASHPHLNWYGFFSKMMRNKGKCYTRDVFIFQPQILNYLKYCQDIVLYKRAASGSSWPFHVKNIFKQFCILGEIWSF